MARPIHPLARRRGKLRGPAMTLDQASRIAGLIRDKGYTDPATGAIHPVDGVIVNSNGPQHRAVMHITFKDMPPLTVS